LALEVKAAADVLDDFGVGVDAPQPLDLSGEIVALLGATDAGVDDGASPNSAAQIGVNVKQSLPGGVSDRWDASLISIAA
jgi:hypothetical protein